MTDAARPAGPAWPDVSGLSDDACRLLLTGYQLGLQAGEERAWSRIEQVPQATTAAEIACEWERGVCLCSACGAVVQVLGRPHRPAKVIDADGREHYCERQVAAVLQRHGVPGMEPLLRKHGDRRPLVGMTGGRETTDTRRADQEVPSTGEAARRGLRVSGL
jgi:hypothetical protein